MRWFGWLFLVLALSACSASKLEPVLSLPEAVSPEYDQFFFSEVKPLLDKRCVSCHSCYTAPCQLNLAHMEGIRRGATKTLLYDGSRLSAVAPTRLFVDAHTVLEWMQNKEFFPVARPQIQDLSILESLVTQRVQHPGPVKIAAKESHECPATPAEVGAYQEKFTNSGMPYGFPALTPHEQRIIARWMENGYPKLTSERARELSQPVKPAALVRWENLLNDNDPRHRLVARYLYEHLYLGHLQLPDAPGEFYRLVRSRTGAPLPPDVIATRWPFDSPGGPFSYRLMKIEETITLKNHLIYPLGNDTWKRWQELFFADDWAIEAKDLPSYDAKVAANPFLSFQAIPPVSRYHFMLDNSLFFVSAFIKGPVCEGSIAVNVIDEHFFIFFLNPRQDLANQDPNFLARAAGDLSIPSQSKNDTLTSGFYVKFKAAQLDFVKQRQKRFAETFPRGLQLDDIWDGDGKNPQAVLTVFRHFDNSTVTTGARGQLPKTVWVMDYPIFERMYYLLSAGFDVFGNVFHQGATRMYMDNLRVESEDLFLSFLNENARDGLRKSWYRGLAAEELMKYLNPYGGVPASSQIPYYSKDPRQEFIHSVLNERFSSKVRGTADGPRGHGEDWLFQLSGKSGVQFAPLPDLTFLLVEGNDHKDRLYSLVHHKEHLNVSFMFGEDGRRVPGEDRLDVVPGVQGAFPNYFLRVKEDQIPAFVQDTLNLEEKNVPKMQAWANHYGVSRQDPNFWQHFDRVQALTDQERKEASGRLDLSKYELW